MRMRIGQGYDVHAFASVESSPSSGDCSHIVIGGVSIPYKVPLLAHSDGDVLVHALADALLGALALGDIGQHFPDTDSDYRNVDSRQLLRQVMTLVADRGYGLVNVDMTIFAQRPKMAEYIPSLCEHIASDAAVCLPYFILKATDSDKFGFTSREDGISFDAVGFFSNTSSS